MGWWDVFEQSLSESPPQFAVLCELALVMLVVVGEQLFAVCFCRPRPCEPDTARATVVYVKRYISPPARHEACAAQGASIRLPRRAVDAFSRHCSERHLGVIVASVSADATTPSRVSLIRRNGRHALPDGSSGLVKGDTSARSPSKRGAQTTRSADTLHLTSRCGQASAAPLARPASSQEKLAARRGPAKRSS
jgi:hypothetical protein